ncbi:Succinyl-CoA ligase [ADP-forming] subunit beta [Candidatus Arsenophonus lipoptenae]|uniref:Succinate--CoA ligase [ADP-forming] subunit beta n=1 Tax=Candidatus Arsenophonus lipoptenae TaxID=634113 RepID=A0A0X9VE69_9GAMM|nr:ADP-forming succinate--CoA ligase subunit beta [Candidatus Arsenophonus lipoptenae]AMA64899.1 Succinyl-CoA ligase [ADP-forming] subunit beta [Candidatus Arsenophonus lipoptenae]
MNLHEYQAKQLLSYHGLPIPKGYVCTTLNEVYKATSKLGNSPWVVKCQIHAGGRGQAGGVQIINNMNEIRLFTEYWLGKRLITYQTDSNGQPVNYILVESMTKIEKELYLGAIIDRSSNRIIFLASIEGGIEIEKVAKKTPELIHKIIIDPLTGPMPYQGRELAYKLDLNNIQIEQFSKIFIKLANIFLKYDLMLIEINPLVITNQKDLICLDSKINIDNNALYRQKKLSQMRDISQEDPNEAHALEWDLNYVALNGNIGCMINGAGLAMGTMDIVKLNGGTPANFLDVGGSATKERVKEAFKIILSDSNVKAILVNIFGGIVLCDLIADGIIEALQEIGTTIPIVVRLEGNNAELGNQKLSNSGLKIITATSLQEAAKKVVAAVEVK